MCHNLTMKEMWDFSAKKNILRGAGGGGRRNITDKS